MLATFTAVLGLVTLYLSGSEMWEGIAASVIVGLLVGTSITLVLILALYSITTAILARLMGLFTAHEMTHPRATTPTRHSETRHPETPET